MNCGRCGRGVDAQDGFCGHCGEPVSGNLAGNGQAAAARGSWPGAPDDSSWSSAARDSAARSVPVQGAGAPGGFFSHARAQASHMTNATRYLCAAAYLSPTYASTVIKHLVSSHRAVAPSVGIDLGPIMRHCLRARSMQRIRDVTMAFLLILGLVLIPGRTIEILVVSFFLGFLPSVDWGRKSLGLKVLATVGSVFLLGSVAEILIAAVGIASLQSMAAGMGGTSDPGAPATSPSGGLSSADVKTVLLVAAIIATQVVYIFMRSRTLCDELGPEPRPRPHRRRSALVEARIAEIDGAQYGNVVLYSGKNPFVGTGQPGRVWSIAIELQRENDGNRAPWGPAREQSYVPIDPVELHQVIRQRLLRLKDNDLPPNERLSALVVADHVVGTGLHRFDSPLIDPARVVPYSWASAEARDALIRHPQAGVRYYQRVSVCDEGQAVWAGQRKVMDGSDQDISASALVHIAVEGRMFYLEFVSAVMPPVDPAWRLVDVLPEFSSGRFLARVLLDAFSSLFRALFYAPVQVCRAVATLIREGRSYKEDAAAAQEYLFGDIGAQISVREVGAAKEFLTYIQKFDAEKYVKLVERLINDTVLDFLAAKGVDTSAYAASAGVVINNAGVMIGNNNSVNGSSIASGGVGGRVRQQQGQQ
jgi:hypothetical protein